MITKKIDRSEVFKMEKILGTLIVALAYVLGTLFNECSATDSSYFLFQPPYTGKPQESAVAEQRSDSDNEIVSSSSFTPSETLWVGSHKINWNPLPLFLKFSNPNLYQPKQQQPQAQARKFETIYGSSPTKEPYVFQKPTPLYSSPPPYNPQTYNNNNQQQSYNQQKSYNQQQSYNQPQPPQQNKFLTFPSFNLFQSRPQPPPSPKPQLYKLIPHQNIEPRISNKPGHGYLSPPPIITARSDTSTPSPIFVSTSASILVSPPGTVRALSTPGPSIKPIVDRLKKMTQWSQKKQRKLSKKEGKTVQSSLDSDLPLDPLERRLRLKKRLNVKAKSQKHNIEAIILENDNYSDENTSASAEMQKFIAKEEKSRQRTRIGKTSMSRESIEDKAFPSNDIIIIHPSNLKYLDEPITQQSTVKKYEIKRKDKKMGFFKSQDSLKKAPAPVSFRFGPEDAKVSPYL